MSRKAAILFATIPALAWGQVQYIRGFDQGADTSLCIGENMILKTPVKEIAACQRIWPGDPSHVGLRLWRRISGDGVKS